MTEDQACRDLQMRGVWRLAPGLWCDKSTPDLIAVAPEKDTALQVRAALTRAKQLPTATK